GLPATAFAASPIRARASARKAASAAAPPRLPNRARRFRLMRVSLSPLAGASSSDRIPRKLLGILSLSLEVGVDVARDEPRPALVAGVGQGPLEHHHEAVAEPDEIEDVDEAPHEPGEEAMEAQPRDLGDRRASADDGQRALVEVVEGPQRLAPEAREDG